MKQPHTAVPLLSFCRRHPGAAACRALLWLAAGSAAGILLALLVYVLARGLPHLTPSLFAWQYTSSNCSMTPAIVNTLHMTLLSLLLAVPAGVGGAIYLAEYAGRESRVVQLIRVTAQTLAGIPSIVYGLFGYLVFVIACRFGYSLLSGALTMAIMVLPLILRTAEEALRAVPDLYREGSFGLGAGHLRTLWHIVLPSAMPGILSGVILSVGRIVGETAALLYTAGTVAGVAPTPLQSGRTLSVHMYCLLSEGLHMEQAYPAALVLLLLVLAVNGLSSLAARKLMTKGTGT